MFLKSVKILDFAVVVNKLLFFVVFRCFISIQFLFFILSKQFLNKAKQNPLYFEGNCIKKIGGL